MANRQTAWERASRYTSMAIGILATLGAVKGLSTTQARALLGRIETAITAVRTQLDILDELTAPIEDPDAKPAEPPPTKPGKGASDAPASTSARMPTK